MKFSIGIIGAGAFARHFVPLFKAHPNISEVRVADTQFDRAQELAHQFKLEHAYDNAEDLIASDVDAVAVFVQRHLHAPLSLAALNAGKHVYCAVPAACSLEELDELTSTVKKTGLTFMMGETSYYYPSVVFCRNRWNAGDFGDFVYGEGSYYHDMDHGFYDAFRHSGGADWKKAAGFPPMMYPTHSTAMILGVTGARMTSVSCLGYRDRHEDGIFREGGNYWDNPFSNQTALFRTSDGGMVRTNEFRRVGGAYGRHGGVLGGIYGTGAVFEQISDAARWTTHGDYEGTYDVNGELAIDHKILKASEIVPGETMGTQKDFQSGEAGIHPVDTLPESFRGLPNGHMGSHQFLADDFCRAVAEQVLPPNNVWDAARYNAPGLVAHQSSLKDGETLSIPDFGTPPDGPRLPDRYGHMKA